MLNLVNGSVQLSTDTEHSYITFVSLNAAPGRVVMSGESLMVTAPARVFRPGALQVLADAVCSVASQVFESELSAFEVETGIHCDAQKICRAVCRLMCPRPLDSKKLRALIELFCSSLLTTEVSTQVLLPNDPETSMLSEDQQSLITKAAEMLLSKFGGSPVTYPCSVYLDGQKIAEVRGMFAPRPHLDITPEQITVRASVDGYRRQKRAAFLLLDDGQAVTANWAHDADFDVVRDLAIGGDSFVDIRLVRELDAKGNVVYTLVS